MRVFRHKAATATFLSFVLLALTLKVKAHYRNPHIHRFNNIKAIQFPGKENVTAIKKTLTLPSGKELNKKLKAILIDSNKYWGRPAFNRQLFSNGVFKPPTCTGYRADEFALCRFLNNPQDKGQARFAIYVRTSTKSNREGHYLVHIDGIKGNYYYNILELNAKGDPLKTLPLKTLGKMITKGVKIINKYLAKHKNKLAKQEKKTQKKERRHVKQEQKAQQRLAKQDQKAQQRLAKQTQKAQRRLAKQKRKAERRQQKPRRKLLQSNYGEGC